jgi:hypothetical protein
MSTNRFIVIILDSVGIGEAPTRLPLVMSAVTRLAISPGLWEA